jgi:phosphate transport system substrate-binding protein
MDRRRIFLVMVALTVAVALLSGCGRNGGAASKTQLNVTGSTTILPIAEIAGEDFQTAHPLVRVLVSGVGSSAGIEAVTNGTAEIGTSSRELKPEETTLGLVDTKIARDAIAVIVNPTNPVTSLTTSQVADIFAGKIVNWSQLGGQDLPIGLVNRDEASGTRDAFSKLVLKDLDFDPTAAVLPGTGQVRSVVAQSKSAIGYISLGFVDKTVKALVIDNVTPSEKTVADGSYPLSRVLHFFTKGPPAGLAKEYIDFVLSSKVQDTVVRDAGFLPIAEGGK